LPAFSAESVVEPLDYSLRPHVNKNGTIKEPTDKQIAEYLAALKKLMKDFRGQLPDAMVAGSTDVGAMLDAVDDLDAEIAVKLNEQMAQIASDLCSGDPSKDDILAIPPRIRAMFLAWLQREVMSPEAAPGGGSSATKLRAVAG
jgi:hypothetical protein